MENPFPLNVLTLVSNSDRRHDFSGESSLERKATEETWSESCRAERDSPAVHNLEELLQLAFPKSFERRLRLVTES